MLCEESWHPDIRRLYQYWRAIHPAQGLPGRQHFDPLAVGPLLSRLWLVDVQRQPFRLRYRLVGTQLTERAGRELTGLWFDEAHPEIVTIPNFYHRFRMVCEDRQPSWRRGPPGLFFLHKVDILEIENLFLPLAQDGETVDMLCCLTITYSKGTSAELD